MSEIIENFYKENNIIPVLLQRKMRMFNKHDDIALEFEHWIKTSEYVLDNPVTESGYTASKLAKDYPNLDGEGAFMVLIELRDNKEKTLEQIKTGFKRK